MVVISDAIIPSVYGHIFASDVEDTFTLLPLEIVTVFLPILPALPSVKVQV
jgi:hypothetical protein